MNLSKKTLKYLKYVASLVPEYPRCCFNCDNFEEGDCNCSSLDGSELWCPYQMYTPKNFQDGYQFMIETRYEPQFKEWKRSPDPLYRRLRRNYIRYFKKRKKAEKKKRSERR